uniref:Uncharacterized protein n=1 Tax=Gossypium raimondii TaxID=29730 RepID=A0A0D2TK98_GOSRA|nr:hypothetical protein B456_007G237800 [Gossypium raimondii]
MGYISCPLSGWAARVGEGQSLILKTKESEGGKLSTVPEWDSNSALFEILRRVALWRAHYCLSLASMVEPVRGLRGGALPCGRCQRFESAYLQLVNLVEDRQLKLKL